MDEINRKKSIFAKSRDEIFAMLNNNKSAIDINEPGPSTSRNDNNQYSSNSSQLLQSFTDMYEARLDLIRDDTLLLWQYSQMMQCLQENSSNEIIETYFRQPEDPSEGVIPTEFLAGVALEMAISSHGLRSHEIDAYSEDEDPADIFIVQQYQSTTEIPRPGSHDDFMEAAVGVAIQKKGLANTTQLSPTR